MAQFYDLKERKRVFCTGDDLRRFDAKGKEWGVSRDEAATRLMYPPPHKPKSKAAPKKAAKKES